MARILIAADPVEITRAIAILGPEHESDGVTTMQDAEALLQEHDFDLIMVGLHFEQSRLFEVLPRLRSGRTADTPVICFCARRTHLSTTLQKTIEDTVNAWGAWMYLDQYAETIKRDKAEMKRLIERCLTDESRKANMRHRVDIQERRGELIALHAALDEQPWSAELEDELGELRRQLARVLLDLSDLHVANISQQEQVEASNAQRDRVPDSVRADESALSKGERSQSLAETRQSVQEQTNVEKDEVRRRAGRRRPDEGDAPEAT